MERAVWFQLVDPRGDAFEGSEVGYVELSNEADIDDFVEDVKKECHFLLEHVGSGWLAVFATVNDVAQDDRLPSETTIRREMGRTAGSPLFVRVPDRAMSPVVTVALPPALAEEQLVSRVLPTEPFVTECGSLDTWKIGVMHDIPTIHAFFEQLGGCTDKGKLLWREEDRDVAKFILGGWLDLEGEAAERLGNKRALLVGSPGVGKSTLLCLLAFHVVLKHKKNVLIYRQLKNVDQGYCLVYLGHDHVGQVVFSTVRNCKPIRAIAVYDWLKQRDGIANVWLFLDGFVYKEIPAGLETFRLLATSQQVRLSSQESVGGYAILHSCWTMEDLFMLGEVYEWEETEMIERFRFSGGSAREFVRPSVREMKCLIDNSMGYAGYPLQIDRFRHTFVNRRNIGPNCTLLECYLTRWEQVADSEYALQGLSHRLTLDHVKRMYHWAKARGPSYASLAGHLFEIMINSLASHNVLTLTTSPYALGELGEPIANVGHEFKRLPLQRGGVLCSGTEKTFMEVLTEWRDDDRFSYWYPEDSNFPNIDAIVKLKDKDNAVRTAVATGGDGVAVLTEKKVRVAYLQMTVGKKHRLCEKTLREMTKVFDSTDSQRPLLVVLGPSRTECEKVELEQRAVVDAAQNMCEVCVGYYGGECVALAINRLAQRARQCLAAESELGDGSTMQKRQ